MITELLAGLAIGALGSFHCVGMCGPIALAVPTPGSNALSRALSSVLYNSGRAVTYTAMGAMVGLVGGSLAIAEYQEQVSIAAGSMMLLVLLVPMIFKKQLSTPGFMSNINRKLKDTFGYFLRQKSYPALLGMGMVNGLLPCGLVYVALAGAAGSASVLSGAVFMAGFGLGTLPVMSVLAFGKNYITPSLRGKMNKFIPYGVAVVALIMIMRGMALGIPYISPELPKTVVEKANCCH